MTVFCFSFFVKKMGESACIGVYPRLNINRRCTLMHADKRENLHLAARISPASRNACRPSCAAWESFWEKA